MKPLTHLCSKVLGFVSGANKVTEVITLFFTYVAVMLWTFWFAQNLIGQRSIWWLVFGPLLVIAFQVLLEVGLNAGHEVFKQPVIRVLGSLVGLLRNILTLCAIVYLTQALRRAIDRKDSLTLWDALWQILKGG